MMPFIKHRNMRDVAAEVIDWSLDPIRNSYEIRVLWHNLLGTRDHPSPFPMWKNSKTPAIEIINISIDNFKSDWTEAKNIDSLRSNRDANN